MNPKQTDEFAAVKRQLNSIARAEPVQALKDDVVEDIIKFAHKVPKMYDSKISVKKGQEDTKKGALTAAVAAVVFSVIKSKLGPAVDLDPQIEASLMVLITAAITGIFHGLQSWLWNWQKHRIYKVQ